MDETGSGGKMTTPAAQPSATGGVKRLSAASCLSSAPQHFFFLRAHIITVKKVFKPQHNSVYCWCLFVPTACINLKMVQECSPEEVLHTDIQL